MKKSILSVFAGLFIITTLFAQDAKEENHAGVKYTTHITSVITYPWGVQLNVYNITDARYIVSSHGANGNMNLPGAPRNVMLKLSYRM